MKLIHFLIFNFLILLTFSSCEKDEDIETPSTLFAGIFNDSLIYTEFNPPSQIAFKTDTIKKIKYGTDSLDIDLDGSYDIFISQRIYLDWHENFNRLYLEENNFPYIGLKLSNEFEVAYKVINVNVGEGYTNSMWLVNPLSYEVPIDKIENWSHSNVGYFGIENHQIWLYGVPPLLYWSCGPWYTMTNMEVYIGLRQKNDLDYKFGWIKVKVDSKDKIEIESYAIEK